MDFSFINFINNPVNTVDYRLHALPILLFGKSFIIINNFKFILTGLII